MLMTKPRDEGGEGGASAVPASMPTEERLNTWMDGTHDNGVHKRGKAAAKSDGIDEGRRETCKKPKLYDDPAPTAAMIEGAARRRPMIRKRIGISPLEAAREPTQDWPAGSVASWSPTRAAAT